MILPARRSVTTRRRFTELSGVAHGIARWPQRPSGGYKCQLAAEQVCRARVRRASAELCQELYTFCACLSALFTAPVQAYQDN